MNTKEVSIFLASSINELAEERLAVTDYIDLLNKLFANQLVFRLRKCEHESDRLTVGRKQEQYNEIIRICDYFYMLIGQRLGKYTEEEFDAAWARLKETKKRPVMFVYFKEVDKTDDSVTAFKTRLRTELEQFDPKPFTHIDSVKLNMLLDFKRDRLLDVEFRDGQAVADGRPVMDLDNIPLYARHEELQRLRAELDGLDDSMAQRRAELTEQIHGFEMELLRLCGTIAEMGADGRPLTRREKQARELAEKGDSAGALAILRDIQREKELRRAEEIVSAGTDGIRGYIGESRLRIDLLRAESVRKNDGEIRELYEKCVSLAERYRIEYDVMYDYAEYLWRQNSFKRAIEVGERLEKLYDLYPPDDWDRGRLYNLLGMCYDKVNDHRKGEEIYRRSLELWRKTAETKTSAVPEVATTCNNLANLLANTNRMEEAEELYREALENYRSLAAANPSAYEPYVATTCNNLAVLLKNTNHMEEAEELYRETLKIRRKLAAANPSAYEPDVAETCNNFANLLANTNRKEEAEELYREALKIYRNFASANPSAYEPYVAQTCNNLAVLYATIGNYSEAEKMFCEALENYRSLAAANPSAYEPDVAVTCNNLAALYATIGNYSEAEKMFCEALKIRRRLAAANPSAYEPYVAATCFNLGLFELQSKDNTAAAFEYFREAKELYGKYPHLVQKAEMAQYAIDLITGA